MFRLTMLIKSTLLLAVLVAYASGDTGAQVPEATAPYVLEKRNPPDPNIWLHNTPAPSALAAQINAGVANSGYGNGYGNYYGYGWGNYGSGYGYGYYGKRR
ncbi:hypothetical protein L596_012745 [Steinernema carpocapsae]|uniref:Uncharacterized protein n=1 Tax=Steinernema carpocapsae TaxID=34508 RepID=A0A4U5NY12_STECR|nr:hypothetical protein L596_012745 [Steinernema carpocapsae]